LGALLPGFIKVARADHGDAGLPEQRFFTGVKQDRWSVMRIGITPAT